MFGKILGRFYLGRDLGLSDDDTHGYTISELVETFPAWSRWISQLPPIPKRLFTMFETSDVHPDIIREMKLFDKVIVPYDYLRDILLKRGVNCEALNEYTSPLIRHKPEVIQKKCDPDRLVFLYVGTNDIRKNLTTLTRAFVRFSAGTRHTLLVKTNHALDLPESDNRQYVTAKVTMDRLAGMYNTCDYVISCTRGEGVGLPFLEASYFNKPVIAHTGGVLGTLAKSQEWIPLPHREVPTPSEGVPDYLQKVFYGTWWEVSEDDVVSKLSEISRDRQQHRCSP
jgi:glycosyltransferase involved in cell wall biosynthesis